MFIAGDVILGKVAANIYADVQEEAKIIKNLKSKLRQISRYRQSLDWRVLSRALNGLTSLTTTLQVPSRRAMVPLMMRNGDLNLFSWLS